MNPFADHDYARAFLIQSALSGGWPPPPLTQIGVGATKKQEEKPREPEFNLVLLTGDDNET